MSKFFSKPKAFPTEPPAQKYERFNLKDNPFPAHPVVDKFSKDPRLNGSIFEQTIRHKEHKQFVEAFLQPPRDSGAHLRLGFIMDTSFIGRGNGKTAFIVHTLSSMNDDFAYAASDGSNKCIGVYVPRPSSDKSKSFGDFLDSIWKAMHEQNTVATALSILYCKALLEVDPTYIQPTELEALLQVSREDFWEGSVRFGQICTMMREAGWLDGFSQDFPLKEIAETFFSPDVVTSDSLNAYYRDRQRSVSGKMKFLFDDLVHLFRLADFNGVIVFVDDFERIPEFQSNKQKKDFAMELRSGLMDGPYLGSRLGFFTMILTLHAGVPRLMQEAWEQSGMEHRVAMLKPSLTHVVRFERLGADHALALVQRYLVEYRLRPANDFDFSPFTKESILKLGEANEMNASRLLFSCYNAVERAASDSSVQIIDGQFIDKVLGEGEVFDAVDSSDPFDDGKSLLQKAHEETL